MENVVKDTEHEKEEAQGEEKRLEEGEKGEERKRGAQDGAEVVREGENRG